MTDDTDSDSSETLPWTFVRRTMLARRIGRDVTELKEKEHGHRDTTLSEAESALAQYEHDLVRRANQTRHAQSFDGAAAHGLLYKQSDYMGDDYDGPRREGTYTIVVWHSGEFVFRFFVTPNGEAWTENAHNTQTGERVERDAFVVPTADAFREALDALDLPDDFPREDVTVRELQPSRPV